MFNDDEELEYRSTATSNILAPIAPNQKDVADQGAINASIELLDNRIAYYDSVDSLGTDVKEFTVKQQLAINKKVKYHLVEVRSELVEAIQNVRGQ